MIIFFVVRPLLAATGPATGGGGAMPRTLAGVRALPSGPGGGQAQVSYDASTGEPLALSGPVSNPEMDSRIDIAKIEGQVRVSSVKSVSDFVDRHPEESVSILRGWLHEA
jgi:flagellar M-ring protein FliF